MAFRLTVLVLGVASCVLAVQPAIARTPTEDVRRSVEEAFQGLIDSESSGEPGKLSVEQRRALRKAADKIFDWPEMARVALGPHWAQATPAERERFAGLFARLFERLYVPLVERDESQGDKLEDSIRYVGETVRGERATLHLRWKRAMHDVVVDCAMRRKAGTWRIHDVAFDGLSVIENYRAQFDHVIQRGSYQELLTRMEARLNPTDAGRPAPVGRRLIDRLPRLAESP